MEARGRCGGPLTMAAPQVRLDGPKLANLGPEFEPLRGRPYLPDSAVLSAPFTRDAATELGRWRVCPLAEVAQIRQLLAIHGRVRLGVSRLTDEVPVPSAALVEAMEVLTVVDVELENAAIRAVGAG